LMTPRLHLKVADALQHEHPDLASLHRSLAQKRLQRASQADYWRKRAAETRGLAEVIEDQYTAETLLEIALRYDALALRGIGATELCPAGARLSRQR
jgi:hypothetical protein